MLLNQLFEKREPTPQYKVFMYIISHTDGDTKIFKGTYKEIQEKTGVSQMTIANVFDIMKKIGAVVYVKKGEWKVPIVEGYSRTYDGFEPYVVSELRK